METISHFHYIQHTTDVSHILMPTCYALKGMKDLMRETDKTDTVSNIISSQQYNF